MPNVVEGKGGIKVTLLKHSVSESGQQIASFECEYHRLFHAEVMTHRVFSRNAASSRAIPIKKAIEQVKKFPAMPVFWGKNQSGMQAKEELAGINKSLAQLLWNIGGYCAGTVVGLMDKVGLHKQLANRLLEPFQMIKVVITATSYDNFFYLRNHEAAQPEFQELAKLMWETLNGSTPQELKAGEWHLPYVNSYRNEFGDLVYYTKETITNEVEGVTEVRSGTRVLTLEEAQKLSASLCAQVSYRLSDQTLEKAYKIYDILVGMKPAHSSPFEHAATPMKVPKWKDQIYWEEGVTHMDTEGYFWSGNLKGWIQYRQLIPNHVYTGDK